MIPGEITIGQAAAALVVALGIFGGGGAVGWITRRDAARDEIAKKANKADLDALRTACAACRAQVAARAAQQRTDVEVLKSQLVSVLKAIDELKTLIRASTGAA